MTNNQIEALIKKFSNPQSINCANSNSNGHQVEMINGRMQQQQIQQNHASDQQHQTITENKNINNVQSNLSQNTKVSTLNTLNNKCYYFNSKNIPRNNNNSNTSNEMIENEKSNFINIVRSLFAIFDTDCRGLIDVNELDNLGANNNEILKDVLTYIRSNEKSVKNSRSSLRPTTSMVSFDDFVNASEVVLERRKLNRVQQQYKQQQQQQQQQQGISSSYIIKRPRTLSNLLAENLTLSKNAASSTTFSTVSTSSSSSSSSISPPSSIIKSTFAPATTTLSQVFDNTSTVKPSFLLTHAKVNEHSLSNANSLDINSLIDKENSLLKQGLDLIDYVKQWYLNQLIQNKLKLSNVNKIKHQNLFSIDKMLVDLKQLNELNTIMEEFLAQNKFQPLNIFNRDVNVTNNNQNKPLDVQTIANEYGCATSLDNDAELDNFLKEKQDKIDNLQKEKSMLVRKLLEVKSKSDNINDNIQKLKRHQNDSNEITIPSATGDSKFSKEMTDTSSSKVANFIELNKLNEVKINNCVLNLNKPLTTSKIKKLV